MTTTPPRDPFRPECDKDPSRPDDTKGAAPMRPENMKETKPLHQDDGRRNDPLRPGTWQTDTTGFGSGIAKADSTPLDHTNPLHPEGIKHTDPTRPEGMKSNPMPSDTPKHSADTSRPQAGMQSDPMRPAGTQQSRPTQPDSGKSDPMHREGMKAADTKPSMASGESTRMRPSDGDGQTRQARASETGRGPEKDAAELADSARNTAADLAETAKDRAREYAEAGKERGAERISGVARAIHGAADSLEEESPFAANYVRQAATGIDHVSQALSRRSVDDLLGTMQDYGRRNPAMLFGGALLAGVLLSRFMKSSAERHGATHRREPGRHGMQASHRPTIREAGPRVRSEAGETGRMGGGSVPTGR